MIAEDFSSLLLSLSLVLLQPTVQRQSRPALADMATGIAQLRYSLTPGPCNKDGCPVIVRLMNGQQILDSYQLHQGFPSPKFAEAELQLKDGAGDPSGHETSIAGWRSETSDDEDFATLSARPFRLTANFVGILIDQRAGFETLRRWHTLLAVKDNRLLKLWEGSEGEGPTSSTTVRISRPDHSDILLFYSMFYDPSDGAPDKLQIQALAYNDQAGE